MSVLFIKLSSDEDIISETEENEEFLILINPARIAFTRDGVGIGEMNPFIKDKKITVSKKFVVYHGTPTDEILNAYNSKFGSGLIVAGGGLIV
jgi:hypothetical protein